jgi:hypothetical protein
MKKLKKRIREFICDLTHWETFENQKRSLNLLYRQKNVDYAEVVYSTFVGPMTIKRWYSNEFKALCSTINKLNK